MPELPEVEVVRAGLASHVLSRPIAKVNVFNPRAVRRQEGGADQLIGRLAGRQFSAAGRRGKFMWLTLDTPGEVLIVHLGMSGQMLVRPADAPLGSHTRIRVQFCDGGHLDFVDQRTFGYWLLDEWDDQAGVPQPITHIAPDLLDPLVAAKTAGEVELITRMRTRARGIKALLLDQGMISGIGNIYADEMLWRSSIHGNQPANTLTIEQSEELLRHGREVLTEALAAGGTTFDAMYVNVDGASGYFERALAVYGKQGEPCPRCGEQVVREKFANRSSHRCPVCQVWPLVK